MDNNVLDLERNVIQDDEIIIEEYEIVPKDKENPEENSEDTVETFETEEDIENIETEELVEVQVTEEKTIQNADLSELQHLMVGLNEKFDDKIKNDEYKNKLFDNMHRELVELQNGSVERLVNSICLDIIQLSDYVKKIKDIYVDREHNEENYCKLLSSVDGIVDRIDDILYGQSIEPYNVGEQEVDVRKQKILSVIETEYSEKDNTVAEVVACGYEKDGKIIRPERIKVYKYIKK